MLRAAFICASQKKSTNLSNSEKSDLYNFKSILDQKVKGGGNNVQNIIECSMWYMIYVLICLLSYMARH